MHQNIILPKYLFIVVFLFAFACCQTIDVFEKTTAFSTHKWKSNEKLSFNFEIKDTVSVYNIYLVLRHEDAYSYNNIWLNLTEKNPAESVTVRREFILGNNNMQRWLGSGMDDIFEHRILINPQPRPLHKGIHTFTLEQDMREDPLEHILNAGIRVEKVK